MKEVVSTVRSRRLPTFLLMPAVVPASENVVHPRFSSVLRRTSRCRSHHRPSWSPTIVILIDSEEMGVRATCCPITSSICLITSHTSTVALCGVPRPRAKGPTLQATLRMFLGFSPYCGYLLFGLFMYIFCSYTLWLFLPSLQRYIGRARPTAS